MLEFEVLDHAESAVGTLILRRRNPPEDHVIELCVDHALLMSTAVTVSERALATRAIEMHGGSGLDVLVGGLGLGATAKAALESDRVAHVEVIELVEGVIAWALRGVIPLGKELTSDPRFHVTQADVYALLQEAPARTYDLILIDVDHSPDDRIHESSASFYTRDSLARARAHLAPGGVFAVWSTSPCPAFEAELRETYREVRAEPIDFHNETTRRAETNWLFLAR